MRKIELKIEYTGTRLSTCLTRIYGMKDSVKIFLRWLKVNDLYEKYKEETFSFRGKDNVMHKTHELFNQAKPHLYILGAFDWGHTEDGLDFWSEKNDMWIIYFRQAQ